MKVKLSPLLACSQSLGMRQAMSATHAGWIQPIVLCLQHGRHDVICKPSTAFDCRVSLTSHALPACANSPPHNIRNALCFLQ